MTSLARLNRRSTIWPATDHGLARPEAAHTITRRRSIASVSSRSPWSQRESTVMPKFSNALGHRSATARIVTADICSEHCPESTVLSRTTPRGAFAAGMSRMSGGDSRSGWRGRSSCSPQHRDGRPAAHPTAPHERSCCQSDTVRCRLAAAPGCVCCVNRWPNSR